MKVQLPHPPEDVPAAPTPKQNYEANMATLREIIEVDHFSNSVPASIVDLWLKALDPESQIALPPDVRGFYGGELRASIPIELAHDCYKYIVYESDKAKVNKYANRMLIALSLLDMDDLSKKDANLTALALWHKALAQVRLPDNVTGLAETLERYEIMRSRSFLSDAKLPQPSRLKARLLTTVENDDAAAWLRNWEPESQAPS